MLDFMEEVQKALKTLHEELAHANMRSATLEARIDNMLRPGKVTDVDTKKQLYRQEIAEQNGKVVKSAWIPYGQFAGDYKSHEPPVKGQQMWMFSPNGDPRQAIGIPMTWSNQFKSPSDKEDEHVHTYGDKYRLREKKDRREFTLDKVKRVITRDKITTTVNDGNTPKDNNGPKADDEADNDQEAQGSKIVQEKKAITLKTPGVTVTHGEKVYKIESDEGIELVSGGSKLSITPAVIAALSQLITTDGLTKLGSPNASVKVVLETGPATLVEGE